MNTADLRAWHERQAAGMEHEAQVHRKRAVDARASSHTRSNYEHVMRRCLDMAASHREAVKTLDPVR